MVLSRLTRIVSAYSKISVAFKFKQITSITHSKGNIDSRLLNYHWICTHHQFPNNFPNYLFSKNIFTRYIISHFKKINQYLFLNKLTFSFINSIVNLYFKISMHIRFQSFISIYLQKDKFYNIHFILENISILI